MRAWPSPEVPTLPVAGPPVAAPRHRRPAAWSRPAPDGPARMYVCGITPYDATHLGHAATYVAFDLLNRAWRNAGHEVTYVQNVTDVDDPLLERAAKVHVDWVELAERETELFRQDMTALRVLPPGALHRRRRVDPAGRSTLIERLRGRRRGLPGRGRPLLLRRPPTRRSAPSPAATATTMLEIFAERGGDPDRAGQEGPARLRRLARPSARASRRGTARSAPAGPAGTSSAPRSRRSTSAAPSTSRAAAATWSSRTTRCAPATRRSPYPARRSRRSTATPGWSATTARRCRSRAATWSSSRRCATATSTRWRSGWRCCATTTAPTGSGPTPSSGTPSTTLDRWRRALSLGAGAPAAPVVDRGPRGAGRRPRRPARRRRRRPLGRRHARHRRPRRHHATRTPPSTMLARARRRPRAGALAAPALAAGGPGVCGLVTNRRSSAPTVLRLVTKPQRPGAAQSSSWRRLR